MLKGKGRTVLGWTEGCSTAVVQQLEISMSSEHCSYSSYVTASCTLSFILIIIVIIIIYYYRLL